MIQEIGQDNFKKEVLEADETVLVDFNAEWCGPCKMMRPILEEIAEENEDKKKYKIVSVNIDDESGLAEEYEVSSIPCLVLFKNGEEVSRSIGLKPKNEVKEMLEGK